MIKDTERVLTLKKCNAGKEYTVMFYYNELSEFSGSFIQLNFQVKTLSQNNSNTLSSSITVHFRMNT